MSELTNVYGGVDGDIHPKRNAVVLAALSRLKEALRPGEGLLIRQDGVFDTFKVWNTAMPSPEDFQRAVRDLPPNPRQCGKSDKDLRGALGVVGERRKSSWL
jgi:hypothetical protein